jgi:H+/gluconate symporter-like permease
VKVSQRISTNHSPIVLGVSMVAGLGVTLMIIALGVGVIQGAEASSSTIGLLFAAGLVLFILGAVAWFAVVQPQKHFDDINKPAEDEHHGHGHTETAIVEHGEHHPEPAGHSH